MCMDAAVLDEASVGKADLVIADLPCSGLGVLGKKPDLKYRVTQESVEELAQLQRKILTCVREYVKPGGVLLYSTCTISLAENMDNVHWFLEQFPEFAPDPIGERLCPELRDSVQEEGCIQLLPGVHKCDGFFIARLKKKAEAGKKREPAPGKQKNEECCIMKKDIRSMDYEELNTEIQTSGREIFPGTADLRVAPCKACRRF